MLLDALAILAELSDADEEDAPVGIGRGTGMIEAALDVGTTEDAILDAGTTEDAILERTIEGPIDESGSALILAALAILALAKTMQVHSLVIDVPIALLKSIPELS